MIGVRAPRFVAPAAPGRRPRARRGSRRALLPLLAFCGLVMVAASGDTVKFAYLPLYMSEQLHLPAGPAAASSPCNPSASWRSCRWRRGWPAGSEPMKVVMAGTACAVAAHLCYATSTTVVGLVVAQVLLSAMWAGMAGLGVSVAQELYPTGSAWRRRRS